MMALPLDWPSDMGGMVSRIVTNSESPLSFLGERTPQGDVSGGPLGTGWVFPVRCHWAQSLPSACSGTPRGHGDLFSKCLLHLS